MEGGRNASKYSTICRILFQPSQQKLADPNIINIKPFKFLVQKLTGVENIETHSRERG